MTSEASIRSLVVVLFKPAIALMLFSIAVMAGCSSSDNAQIYSFSGPIMGTEYNVKVVLEPGRESLVPELEKGILETLKEVDVLMSTYKPDSEITRFNKSDSLDWFPLSPLTFEVVKQSLEISKETKGAFDITVGPLVNLWGFGPEKRPDRVPSKRDVNRIKKSVGYKLIVLQEDPTAIKKKHSQLYVDLSAIAKGFSVDRVADYLLSHSIDDFLVEVGGEIRIRGEKAGGESWRLAIEAPQEDQRKVHRVLKVTDVAMATSGDYRNYYEMDGQRFSHMVDPRTGYTINHTLASVSVLHKSSATADALATAFMVMGTKQAMEYAVKNNIAAYFIDRSDGEFQTTVSPAFEQYLQR